jgi:photosystem II stability/assembly factor-like uncharacterized protein
MPRLAHAAAAALALPCLPAAAQDGPMPGTPPPAEPPVLVWESLTAEPPMPGTGGDPQAFTQGLAFIGDTLVAFTATAFDEVLHLAPGFDPAEPEWASVHVGFSPIVTQRLAAFDAPPEEPGGAAVGTVLFTHGARSLHRFDDGGRASPGGVGETLALPWRTSTGRLGRAYDGSVTEGRFVAYSDDHGATWSEPGPYPPEGTLDYPLDAVAYAPTDTEQRVVAAGRAGMSYSVDDGATWTQVQPYGPYRCTSVERVASGARDGGHAGRAVAWCVDYAADRATAFVSDDGGETWSSRFANPRPGPTYMLMDAAPDGSLYAYVGGITAAPGRSMYGSFDGGETWQSLGEVWTAWPFQLRQLIVGPDGRLYAGGDGPNSLPAGSPAGGVFRTAEPVVVAAETPAPPPVGALGVRAYPNPSRGSLTVAVSGAPVGAPLRVALHDALGREVAVLHEGPATPEAQFEAESRLAPGVYVVRAETGGVIASQTVTVAK